MEINARTGTKGGRWIELGEREERKSRDKVINGEGKELLDWINDNGLCIIIIH